MLPAEDYFAYYFELDWKEGDKQKYAFFKTPVICWALVEYPDKTREITGMILDSGAPVLDFAATCAQFMGFARSDESAGVWHELALDKQKRYVEDQRRSNLRKKISKYCNGQDVMEWADPECKICHGSGLIRPEDWKKICYCILADDLLYIGKNEGHKVEVMKLVHRAHEDRG